MDGSSISLRDAAFWIAVAPLSQSLVDFEDPTKIMRAVIYLAISVLLIVYGLWNEIVKEWERLRNEAVSVAKPVPAVSRWWPRTEYPLLRKIAMFIVLASAAITFRWFVWPTPLFVWEVDRLYLLNSEQLTGGGPRPYGTYAMWVGVLANTSESNSVIVWKCTATTKSGASFESKTVGITDPITYTVTIDGKPQRFAFRPEDQLVVKSASFPERSWKSGFVIFFFEGVAKDILHQPGTVFRLGLEDTVYQQWSWYEQTWKGQNDPFRLFPGMNNKPAD